jgi:hypothetical protein
MDFVADQSADGRRSRTLTIVDLFTRECLGVELSLSLRAEDVVTTLNHLNYDRGITDSDFVRQRVGDFWWHDGSMGVQQLVRDRFHPSGKAAG